VTCLLVHRAGGGGGNPCIYSRERWKPRASPRKSGRAAPLSTTGGERKKDGKRALGDAKEPDGGKSEDSAAKEQIKRSNRKKGVPKPEAKIGQSPCQRKSGLKQTTAMFFEQCHAK